MYRIINTKDGVEVGATDKPVYIKRNPNGVFVETTREQARGVAYKSTPYNLCRTDGVGAEDTVVVREYDGGDDAVETLRNAESIAEMEDALCEQDVLAAEIQDALCELDK